MKLDSVLKTLKIPALTGQELLKMTEAEIAHAQRLLRALGVATEYSDALTKPDLEHLKLAYETAKQCKGCAGKEVCYRWIPIVENGELHIRYEQCMKFKVSKLLVAANVPKIFQGVRAGADFEITKGNRNAALLAEAAIDNSKGVYFWGKVGVGKTMISCIIANERALIGKPSLFYTIPDLLDDLKEFDAPYKRKEVLLKVCNAPCLIIDDLGAEYQTEWSAAEVFRIMDARYKNGKQTIINSNFSIDALKERIVGYHGDRIARRILAMCEVVYMER